MTHAPHKPLLFVTVGTDHHPFDRLVRWVDGWLKPFERELDCLMQIGRSACPAHARAVEYLDHKEMEAAMLASQIVVAHGGPGAITLSRHCGKVPIVIPRRRCFGEHVDDHQLLFARRLADEDAILLAETETAIRNVLDRSASGELRPSLIGGGDDARTALQRFGDLVDAVVEASGASDRRCRSSWPSREAIRSPLRR